MDVSDVFACFWVFSNIFGRFWPPLANVSVSQIFSNASKQFVCHHMSFRRFDRRWHWFLRLSSLFPGLHTVGHLIGIVMSSLCLSDFEKKYPIEETNYIGWCRWFILNSSHSCANFKLNFSWILYEANFKHLRLKSSSMESELIFHLDTALLLLLEFSSSSTCV